MKYTLILLTMLTFTTFGWVQNEPQEVKSLAIEFHDYKWYSHQFSLWEKELKRNKKDEAAWINLYAAARMARIVAEEMEDKQTWYKKEKEVIDKMSKSIKGTFAYYRILTWYNAVWNAKDKEEQDLFISYVLKAHELDPSNPDIYPNLMNIYEIYRDDPNEQQKVAQLWKASGAHTPNLMALSYNALMNTKQDAILITGGDNDTYPLWIAQHADDFRKDVNVWNIYLIGIPEYRKRLFNATGIPLMEEGKHYEKDELIAHIAEHKGNRELYFYSKGIVASDTALFDKLYNVGVIYQYAETPFNNTALIVHHFENKFMLDYLKYDYYQSAYPTMDKRRNYAYLPGLVSLYQHYDLLGEDLKAAKTRKLILDLGEDFPHLDEIKQKMGLEK